MLYLPACVCISQNGEIFIGNYRSYGIQVLDNHGTTLRTFNYSTNSMCLSNSSNELFLLRDTYITVIDATTGMLKRNFGQLLSARRDTPSGICLSPNEDKIFVCNTLNHEVQVFQTDGTFLRTLETPQRFNYPRGLRVHGDELYVVDQGRFRIHVFSIDNGNYIRTISTRNIRGLSGGIPEQESACDVCLSPCGRFLVVCANDGVFMLERENGNYVRTISDSPSWGACFSPDSTELYVTFFQENCVKVYAV